MEHIRELSNTIHKISFDHIYGEFNTQADALSKDTLSLQEGILRVVKHRASTITSVYESFLL
jgi:hypothetical protein